MSNRNKTRLRLTEIGLSAEEITRLEQVAAANKSSVENMIRNWLYRAEYDQRRSQVIYENATSVWKESGDE